MDTPLRVLLIDDNEDDRALISLVLRQEFGEIEIAEVGEPLAFAEHLARGRITVVVADCNLGWGDARKILVAIRRHNPDCVVVLFTAADNLVGAIEGRVLDLDGYLAKSSAGFIQLPKIVHRALDQRRSRRIGDNSYKKLVEKLPVGIYSVSIEGFVSQVNQTMGAILGFAAPTELIGKDLADFFIDKNLQKQWGNLLAQGGSIQNLEARLQRTDSATIWVRLSVWPVKNENGKLLHFQGTLQDITDYKKAEEELSRRVAAMKHSSGQLTQFTYAVSHDLQEPLQLVARHARALAEHHHGRLDADAHRFIDHIIESTERMQAMIDAILGYLRVGSRPHSFKPIDLNVVVDEALKNIEGPIKTSDVIVTHDQLPTVTADEAQMMQLFQNLIGNAIKFRGQAPPRVHITADEKENEWLLSVQDNGIGIDPANAERIFEIFQRLHTTTEYPGTGIGLAICKGIVGRHGGKIWVHSEPGKGSTFFVAIPKGIAMEPSEQNSEAGL